MKRILSLGLVLTMLCALLTFMPANAATIVANGELDGDATWTLDSEGTMIITGTGSIKAISVIGANENGTNKYNDAWLDMQDSINKVIVSEGITEIQFPMFFSAPITEVILPDSIIEIGSQAFWDCAFQKDDSNYENGALYIGKHLIATKDIVGEYTVKPGTLTITGDAFSDRENYTLSEPQCKNLTKVNIPNSVKSISGYAFHGCTGLKNITIPNGVTNIGNSAFKGCVGLSSVTIPGSVKNLGGFSNCTGLSDINILGGVICIDDYAFSNCTGLIDITIPNSVTSLSGFNNCENLRYIVIPNSVIEIKQGSFSSCDSIENIVIPNSVNSLNGFNNCYGLTNLIIPNGVADIGGFYWCQNLESVTIPNSVKYIDGTVFSFSNGNPANIYYCGNKEQWDNITVTHGMSNRLELLKDAYLMGLASSEIHYNSYNPLTDVQQSANVTVDGKKLSFDQQPLMIDDRVLVPARAVFEALGASVNWDESAQTVTAVKGGNTVSLVIDSDRMYVNGQIKTLDVPAMVINDRTLVPARAVSEAFGCSVKWDEVYSTVIVESK